MDRSPFEQITLEVSGRTNLEGKEWKCRDHQGVLYEILPWDTENVLMCSYMEGRSVCAEQNISVKLQAKT